MAPGPPRPDGAQRPRASPIDIRKDAQPAGSRKLLLLTGIGRRGPGGKPALTMDPRKKAQSLGFMAKAMGRNFFFLIIQWLHFKSHVRTNRGGNYKAACLFVSVHPQSRSCLSSGEVVGGGIKLRLPNSLSLCIYLSVCLLVFFPSLPGSLPVAPPATVGQISFSRAPKPKRRIPAQAGHVRGFLGCLSLQYDRKLNTVPKMRRKRLHFRDTINAVIKIRE